MNLNEAPEQSFSLPVDSDLDERILLLFADNQSAPQRPRDLVRGVIRPNTTILLYGSPKAGKSFVALDLAFAIARGVDWFGCKTDTGAVLIWAGEGSKLSTIEREIAYRKAHDIKDKMAVANLLYADPLTGITGPEQIANAVKQVESKTGKEVKLVIIDTLSRATPGTDENSHQSMSSIIQIIDNLRLTTQAAIMLVHHSGKADGSAERGHSSLRGAVDTVINIAGDETTRTAKVEFQRDMQGGQELRFKLKVIKVNEDIDGHGVTSCHIEPLADMAAGEDTKTSRPRGAAQRQAFDALLRALNQNGSLTPQGGNWPTKQQMSVPTDDWRHEALDTTFEGNANRFTKAKTGLIDGGWIMVRGDRAWIVKGSTQNQEELEL